MPTAAGGPADEAVADHRAAADSFRRGVPRRSDRRGQAGGIPADGVDSRRRASAAGPPCPGITGPWSAGKAGRHGARDAGGVDDLDPVGEGQEKPGLIVRHNYGFGRVLYVGLESTWRWRFKAGDTYHHRFWGQAIRWAASDKPLLVGNEFLRFGPRKPAVPQGQEVEMVVRLRETAKKLPPERGWRRSASFGRRPGNPTNRSH